MSRNAVVINIENGHNYDLTIVLSPYGRLGGVVKKTFSPAIVGPTLGGLPGILRGTIQSSDRIILTSQHLEGRRGMLLEQEHLEALAEHFSDIYGSKVQAYSARVANLG